jgi:TolA-binding protein
MVLSMTACVSVHRPSFATSAPTREWPATLELARNQALVGRFGAADTALADFASRYPGSAETLETAYWRALFAMDPTNTHCSVPNAMALLDAYLGDIRPRQHVAEATTIRRVAGQVDALSKLAANAMAQANAATATAATAKAQASDATARAEAAKGEVTSSQDAEIKRLRDELTKANTELERIKKRLSQQPPKPQ